MAAVQLGYRVHIYAPENSGPAADVCGAWMSGAWEDEAALARFAGAVDVITYEFENVPVAPLARAGAAPAAHPRALAIAQDRLAEKRFVSRSAAGPRPFARSTSPSDLDAGARRRSAPRRSSRPGASAMTARASGASPARAMPTRPGRRSPALRRSSKASSTFERNSRAARAAAPTATTAAGIRAENVHQGGILARSTVPAAAAVVGQFAEARALAEDRRGARLCRRARLRILRRRRRPGVQRDGAARPQLRALDDRGRASPASSRTISARSAACRWARPISPPRASR